jgi:protein SCO1/2
MLLKQAGTLQAPAYQIKAGRAMNSLRMGFLALGAALALGGCGDKPVAPPLEGARIGGPFSLTDQAGKTVTDRDFDGRYRLVYFGYTYCPDVCPTDLQKIGAVLREMEKSEPRLAAKIVPVFITIDPARDTPEVIGRYVAHFHPRLIGLTGSPEAIARVAKAYAVPYSKVPGTAYFTHGTVTYLMGPKGEPIAPLTEDMTPDAMRAEILKWVK